MKVTIVTPSFNQGHYLEQTMQSVLGQGYPELEYVVIDGGSTDGSVDIIRRHESGLAYWCSEPDGGHYAAVNKGFSRSSGEIMAWLNSDDLYCPWTLATVASIMSAHPEIEWLTTLAPLTWTASGLCRTVKVVEGYSSRSILEGAHLPGGQPYLGWIQQESTFWRRSLWDRCGGRIDSSYPLAGDFDLWARFSQHAEPYGVQVPLGGFRLQPEQRSRDQARYIEDAGRSLAAANGKAALSGSHRFHRTLRRIPIVRRAAYQRGLYTGRVIEVTDPYSATTSWKVRNYEFG